MHFVHVRGNKQQSQKPIKLVIHANVGVFQLCVQARQNQIDDDHPERKTEQKDCGQLPKNSPNGFTRMLAKSRCHIDRTFRMMHTMKLPPEPRFVKQDMRSVGE